LSRFFEKILPDAGGVEIFYKNPKGLTLKSRSGRPNFAFFLIFDIPLCLSSGFQSIKIKDTSENIVGFGVMMTQGIPLNGFGKARVATN